MRPGTNFKVCSNYTVDLQSLSYVTYMTYMVKL